MTAADDAQANQEDAAADGDEALAHAAVTPRSTLDRLNGRQARIEDLGAHPGELDSD